MVHLMLTSEELREAEHAMRQYREHRYGTMSTRYRVWRKLADLRNEEDDTACRARWGVPLPDDKKL